jgi:hypothetical protein
LTHTRITGGPKRFNLWGGTREEYAERLTGKRIALVGPANTLKELREGEKIDSYDVVVRANGPQPLHRGLREYMGSRTDIFYTNAVRQQDRRGQIDTRELSVDFVCCYFSAQNRMALKKDKVPKSKHRFFDHHLWRALKTATRYDPHTGIYAIYELFLCHPKELYVTGMTFYQDGHLAYMPEYRSSGWDGFYKSWAKADRHTRHDADRELDLFARLWKMNRSVKVDRILKGICRESLSNNTIPALDSPESEGLYSAGLPREDDSAGVIEIRGGSGWCNSW